MRIVINAITTKKNAGGAFQIASNFIIKSVDYKDVEWYYILSQELYEELKGSNVTIDNSFVFPSQPQIDTYFKVKKQLKQIVRDIRPDVIYTITAPSYFLFTTPEVMRFTNPWVTHPNKYAWDALSFKKGVKMRMYCWLQKILMRKCKFFITQTTTTKDGILRITHLPDENVKVVSNVLPAIFNTIPVNHEFDEDDIINIACISAATTHKNLDILPNVLFNLKKLGVNNIRFFITIPTNTRLYNTIMSEADSLGVRNQIVSFGRVSQKELADIYSRCSLAFFPTLLEVFSASLLEAMHYDLSIVATDFSFNRDVIGEAGLYYEPKNAEMAAKQIFNLISNDKLRYELSIKMKDRLKLYGDYNNHFKEILDFLLVVGNKTVSFK